MKADWSKTVQDLLIGTTRGGGDPTALLSDCAALGVAAFGATLPQEATADPLPLAPPETAELPALYRQSGPGRDHERRRRGAAHRVVRPGQGQPRRGGAPHASRPARPRHRPARTPCRGGRGPGHARPLAHRHPSRLVLGEWRRTARGRGPAPGGPRSPQRPTGSCPPPQAQGRSGRGRRVHRGGVRGVTALGRSPGADQCPRNRSGTGGRAASRGGTRRQGGRGPRRGSPPPPQAGAHASRRPRGAPAAARSPPDRRRARRAAGRALDRAARRGGAARPHARWVGEGRCRSYSGRGRECSAVVLDVDSQGRRRQSQPACSEGVRGPRHCSGASRTSSPQPTTRVPGRSPPPRR